MATTRFRKGERGTERISMGGNVSNALRATRPETQQQNYQQSEELTSITDSLTRSFGHMAGIYETGMKEATKQATVEGQRAAYADLREEEVIPLMQQYGAASTAGWIAYHEANATIASNEVAPLLASSAATLGSDPHSTLEQANTEFENIISTVQRNRRVDTKVGDLVYRAMVDQSTKEAIRIFNSANLQARQEVIGFQAKDDVFTLLNEMGSGNSADIASHIVYMQSPQGQQDLADGLNSSVVLLDKSTGRKTINDTVKLWSNTQLNIIGKTGEAKGVTDDDYEARREAFQRSIGVLRDLKMKNGEPFLTEEMQQELLKVEEALDAQHVKLTEGENDEQAHAEKRRNVASAFYASMDVGTLPEQKVKWANFYSLTDVEQRQKIKNAIPEGIPYNPQIIAEVADGLRTSNSSQHSRDIAFGKDVADAFSNQIAMANTAQLDGIIDEVDNSPHLSPGQKSRLRKERNDQDRANDSVNSKEGQELISRVGNNFYLISTVRPIIDAKLAEIKKAIEKGEKEGLEPHLQIPVPTEEELKRLADDAQAVFFSDNILRNIVGGGPEPRGRWADPLWSSEYSELKGEIERKIREESAFITPYLRANFTERLKEAGLYGVDIDTAEEIEAFNKAKDRFIQDWSEESRLNVLYDQARAFSAVDRGAARRARQKKNPIPQASSLANPDFVPDQPFFLNGAFTHAGETATSRLNYHIGPVEIARRLTHIEKLLEDSLTGSNLHDLRVERETLTFVADLFEKTSGVQRAYLVLERMRHELMEFRAREFSNLTTTLSRGVPPRALSALDIDDIVNADPDDHTSNYPIQPWEASNAHRAWRLDIPPGSRDDDLPFVSPKAFIDLTTHLLRHPSAKGVVRSNLESWVPHINENAEGFQFTEWGVPPRVFKTEEDLDRAVNDYVRYPSSPRSKAILDVIHRRISAVYEEKMKEPVSKEWIVKNVVRRMRQDIQRYPVVKPTDEVPPKIKDLIRKSVNHRANMRMPGVGVRRQTELDLTQNQVGFLSSIPIEILSNQPGFSSVLKRTDLK